MTTIEVKDILGNEKEKVFNVKITTESGRTVKQSLRINSLGILCIGSYKSSFPNYLLNENTTEKWKEVKVLK